MTDKGTRPKRIAPGPGLGAGGAAPQVNAARADDQLKRIGYARVSTVQQDTALQLDALHAAGVWTIYTESMSGIGPRPELQRALAALQPGDVLVVWKLDRIARSLTDLLSILSRLKARGAAIKSLTEPIDTSTPVGEFTMQILGAVAQLERAIIRERAMAGQRAAIQRGVHCGRPRTLQPIDEADLVSLWQSGWYTMHTLATIFGVSESVVKRAIYRVARPSSSSLK